METLLHPIFNQHRKIKKICDPLKKIHISYFSHVNLVNEGLFSVISNNPQFMELYFSKEYFNVDLHTADLNQFGRYVIWDNIPRNGQTLSMGKDAADLGIIHTFSMIEHNHNSRDFFHFSTHVDDGLMNQFYLNNIELLKQFIKYFSNQIKQTSSLSKSYGLKIKIHDHAEGYGIDEDHHPILDANARYDFLQSIQDHLHSVNITKRESECIEQLVRGKTAREISEILGISKRTVEFYVANIKSKFSVQTKSKLIEKILDS